MLKKTLKVTAKVMILFTILSLGWIGANFVFAENINNYFQSNFGITLDNVYWGEFHNHTSYSWDANTNGANTLADSYTYARDVEKLDFVGVSDHADWTNDPNNRCQIWQDTIQTSKDYNKEGSFIVFPGWEYTNTYGLPSWGSDVGYGHKNVIFKSLDNVTANRYGAFNSFLSECVSPVSETAQNLWQELADYRPNENNGAFTGIHTPANTGNAQTLGDKGGAEDHRTDWSVMDKDFVRHVEIHSKWGSSEGPQPADAVCAIPETSVYDYTSGVGDPLSVRNVLYEKWVKTGDEKYALGFIGGTDDHAGKPGSYNHPVMGMEYAGSITGIIAPSLTRDNLWKGLWNRHVIAGTNSPSHTRHPVLMAVETNGKHYLTGDIGTHNNTAILRVLGDSSIKKFEIIVDGCLNQTINGYQGAISLNLGPVNHYIYARAVTDEVFNGETIEHRVWTSPVYLSPIVINTNNLKKWDPYMDSSWTSIHNDPYNSDFTYNEPPLTFKPVFYKLKGIANLTGQTIDDVHGLIYYVSGTSDKPNLHALYLNTTNKHKAGEIAWTSDDWTKKDEEKFDKGAIASVAIIDTQGNIYISDSKYLWSSDYQGKLRWKTGLPVGPKGENMPFITSFFTPSGHVGGITAFGGIAIYDRFSGKKKAELQLDGLKQTSSEETSSLISTLISNVMEKLLWRDVDDNYMVDKDIIVQVINTTFGSGNAIANTPAVLPEPGDTTKSKAQMYIAATLDETDNNGDNNEKLFRIDITYNKQTDTVAIEENADFDGMMYGGKGCVTSPTLSPDGKAIFLGDNKGILYAFDTDSGKEKWKRDVGNMHGSVTVTWDDNPIIYLANDYTLNAIDAQTGNIIWKKDYNYLAEERLKNISGYPRVTMIQGIVTVSPNRIIIPLGLGYKYTPSDLLLWPIESVLVVLDRNGNIINEPYNLRDVSETIAVPDNSGNVHITYCSISSSLAYSLWERGLFPGLPKPLEPVGGIEMFMPNGSPPPPPEAHEAISETWDFTTVSGVGTPIASFTVTPSLGDTNTFFNFDASASSDVEDATADLQVRWDWEGDGIWDTGWAYDKTATHQYSSPATYNVKMQVKDTSGASSLAVRQITVSYVLVPPPNPVVGTEATGQLWYFMTQFPGSPEHNVSGPTWDFTTVAESTIVVSDLFVTSHSPDTYCGLASHWFNWTYFDTNGAEQTQFQLQVDDDEDFTSPMPVDITATSYSTYKEVIVVNSPTANQLAYNTTYYWRVKVWNETGDESVWVDGPSFTTAEHPYPVVDFNFDPPEPKSEENITFTDNSTVYDGELSPTTYLWNFQMPYLCVTPASNCEATSTPVIKFFEYGSKTVNLEITDSDGYSCSASNTDLVDPLYVKFIWTYELF
ncbi:MAG: DUF3604 domain-containing protein [Patescibacteria group bacterium]